MWLNWVLCLAILSACATWKKPDSSLDAEKTRLYLNQHWQPLNSPQIELGPDSSANHNQLPKYILLRLSPKSVSQYGFEEVDDFRLFFRAEITEWLESQQHPEALCTSVNLKLKDDDYLELEVEIVCR